MADVGSRVAVLAVTRAASSGKEKKNRETFTSAQNRCESERTHTHTDCCDVGQVTVSAVDF